MLVCLLLQSGTREGRPAGGEERTLGVCGQGAGGVASCAWLCHPGLKPPGWSPSVYTAGQGHPHCPCGQSMSVEPRDEEAGVRG